MPAIIPIPAFSDNYIWLVREGANAAVAEARAGHRLANAVDALATLRAWNAF